MRDSNIETDTTRELIKTLRRRIVAWQYPPRFQMVEETLAQEFGVSRSPVRQALTYLAAEGLIERLPRRGFRVKQLQLRDVEDLYEFRLALESQVVHALAHKGLSEQALFRLQAIWQEPEGLTNSDVSELAGLDEDFHATLAKEHGNSLIVKHLDVINERLFAFREIDFKHADRVSTTCEEHIRILRLIVSHDANQACEILRHNIYSALGNVENAVIQLVARSYLNSNS